MNGAKDLTRLEQLIDDAKNPDEDVGVAEELSRINAAITRSIKTNSFPVTQDGLLDLSVFTFGADFKAQYEKLKRLQEILQGAVGQYVYILDHGQDTFSLRGNGFWYPSKLPPYPVLAYGIIGEVPLEAGISNLDGADIFLALNFKNGKYIVEDGVRVRDNRNRAGRTVPKESFQLKIGSGGYTGSAGALPYWRIRPDQFRDVDINSESRIEVISEERPYNNHFGLYIGNQEVEKRINLSKHGIIAIGLRDIGVTSLPSDVEALYNKIIGVTSDRHYMRQLLRDAERRLRNDVSKTT